MDRKYLWKFLKQEEDWTYKAGGLESAHIYFKKGTPRDAEVGVHIFRSLDEVIIFASLKQACVAPTGTH